MRRLVRANRDERGFTLVEMLATIMIMGIVIVPITSALTQEMRMIPTAGDRTQAATDTTRINTQFSDDIANAEFVVELMPGSPGAVFNALVQPPTTADASNSPPSGTVGCVDSNSVLPSSQFLFVQQHDLVTGSAAVLIDWRLRIPATGGVRKVQLTRQVPGGTGTEETFITAYCNASDTNVMSMSAKAPDGVNSFNEKVTLTLNLRDKQGNQLQPIVLDAAVRRS